MYSIDLTKIPLDMFYDILTQNELLPSRTLLLYNIDIAFTGLRDEGIRDMCELHRYLKNKNNYPEIARKIGVDENYLIVLNREVGSFIAKPVKLEKFNLFNDDELKMLENAKVKSSKDMYLKFNDIKDMPDIDKEKLERGYIFSNLIRICGVGPVYVHVLYGMGVYSPEDFMRIDTRTLIKEYKNYVIKANLKNPDLTEKDIRYCKRYCSYLML